MALRQTTLDLADATLSGGARLASAGGGLPARITTETVPVLNDGNIQPYNNACFDASGNVWIAQYSASRVRQYDSTLSTLLSTIAVDATVMGIWIEGDRLFVGRYGGGGGGRVREYSASAGTLVNDWALVNAKFVVRVAGASANLVWVGLWSSGALTEYDVTTGAATGRSIAGSWTTAYPDATGLWAADLTNNVVRHYRESDLVNDITVQRTVAQSVSIAGTWHTTYGSGIGVDADGRLHVRAGLFGHVERFLADGTFDRRVAAGLPELDGAVGDAGQRGIISFNSDGSKVAIVSARTDTGVYGSVRVFRTGTQRGRWARAFASAATVKAIMVPGMFGAEWDGGSVASADQRKVRCYYSLDGGSNRTEFTPGTPLALSVTAGQTLTVDADMRIWECVSQQAPYVGGDSGEGITILWDDLTTAAEAITGVVSQPATITGTVG